MLSACGGGGVGDGSVGDGGGGGSVSTPDTTAPNVLSTTPADSATSVARNSAITATFDEDIFATTVDATSFTLTDSGSIFGTVTFDAATNVATNSRPFNLSILRTYNATLSTAITDLSGNPLATDYNWSFTTADGAWQSGAGIEAGTLLAFTPKIDIDYNGNAIAVWAQRDDPADVNHLSIYANRYNASTGAWGAAIEIENDSLTTRSPQMVMDNNGNALAVWTQGSKVYANRYNLTSDTWGTEVLISVTDGYGPQIAVSLATNDAMIVFHSNTTKDVLASEYDSISSTWGTPEVISSTVTDSTNAQIAMNFDGDAVVVWASNDASGVGHGVSSNFFNSTTGTWKAAAVQVESTISNTNAPQVAFDRFNQGLVVWESGGSSNLLARRSNINGAWGTAKPIESGSGKASNLQIVADFNGDALAVWIQVDGVFPNFESNVYWNRYDHDTDMWGTEFLLETEPGNADTPQISLDARGNALAVWRQVDGTARIYSSRYVATTGLWGAAELLSSVIDGAAPNPQIAVDLTGVAAAVWLESDGSGSSNNVISSNFE